MAMKFMILYAVDVLKLTFRLVIKINVWVIQGGVKETATLGECLYKQTVRAVRQHKEKSSLFKKQR